MPAMTPEQKALAHSIADSRPVMLRQARRMLREPTERKIPPQDALLAALHHIDCFRGDSQLGTWLYRVSTNAVLMSMRRQRRASDRTQRALTSLPGDGNWLYGSRGSASPCAARRGAERRAASLGDQKAAERYRAVVEQCDLAEKADRWSLRRWESPSVACVLDGCVPIACCGRRSGSWRSLASPPIGRYARRAAQAARSRLEHQGECAASPASRCTALMPKSGCESTASVAQRSPLVSTLSVNARLLPFRTQLSLDAHPARRWFDQATDKADLRKPPRRWDLFDDVALDLLPVGQRQGGSIISTIAHGVQDAQ